jgi:hypothetical protein
MLWNTLDALQNLFEIIIHNLHIPFFFYLFLQMIGINYF